LIPVRATFKRVATPLEFVTAVPLLTPFSVNETVFPLTAVLFDERVSVAVSVAVPPYVPEAASTAREVAGAVE
jgi:hypothetical protein